MKITRALLSVSNKSGLLELAQFLNERGVEILSTGGTKKALEEAGIPVKYVGDETGFPEIMDGRVKTLHPKIHGGILGLRDNAAHLEAMQKHGIRPIDLVVVNLYPFRETIVKPDVTEEDAVENIDIGGPAMIRAAAKNFAHVAVVVNPSRYQTLMEEIETNGTLSLPFRRLLSQEAYRHTSEYDAAICAWMAKTTPGAGEYPDELALFCEKVQDLRYGENPHQSAAFYREKGVAGGIAQAKQLSGKELSFNNIVDLEAAYRIACDFPQPAAAIIKHTNPCGTGIGDTLAEAYQKAYAADPVSAFGGIIACNRQVDEKTAAEMAKLFVEAIIAPSYSAKALSILTAKKNLRLLEAPVLTERQEWDIKRVSGGLLVQTADCGTAARADMQVVTKRQPTEAEWTELLFAWRVVKHVKSNAIVVAKAGQTVGVGAGQMNRVGAAKIAFEQAGGAADGAVLASDAFFPFRDTIDAAAKAGITAVIQPGGSIRDEESIAAADEAGIAMIFTGRRHFKH